MAEDQSQLAAEKKKGKKKKGDDLNDSKLSKSKIKNLDNSEKEIDNQMLLDLQGKEDIEKREEKVCYFHQLQLIYYCESCEEPICQQCTILGPHNNQLHRINNIQDSYKARSGSLDHIINTNLIQKRDQLLAQIYRVDYRMEEIRFVKTIIERDIRSEFGAMLDRLKSAEGKKLAMLQHDVAELQRDIDKINDIVNSVKELTTPPGDQINFLLRARTLHENIEFCITRPFKANIDVIPYDLPRELTEQRDKFEKMNAAQNLIDFKDQLLLALLKEKTTQAETMTANVEKVANDEINEWALLTDKFSTELKRYQMICFYCASVIEENSINSLCIQNNRTQITPGFGYTTLEPDRSYHGTRRHFFAQPKPELINYGKINDIPETKKYFENTTSRTQLKMFLNMLLQKIRKYCNEKKISLETIFKDHDKNNTGCVSRIAFRYILQEQCQIDQVEIDKLEEFFQDPKKPDQINYAEILKIYSDPKYLAQTDAFKERENPDPNLNLKGTLYDYGQPGKYDYLMNKNPYAATSASNAGPSLYSGYLSRLENLTKNPYNDNPGPSYYK